MGQPSSLERDLERLRRISADLLKAMDAAEAAFLDHAKSDARLAAINFPLEEGMFDETKALLSAWTTRATELIRNLDLAMSAEALSFERLFDKDAGLHGAGFLRRSMPRRKVSAEAIASGLASHLAILGRLDGVLRDVKPVLRRHHRQCEFHLLQIIERRRLIDASLETASREVTDLKAQLRAHMASATSARSPAALADSEAERRAISARQREAQSTEERLVSERETVVRLVEDIESIVDALNAEIAAANIMAAKLSTDIEQGTALLKAALEQTTAVDLPAEVSEQISAFDRNPLAGLGLQERKLAADGAFNRRLAPIVPPTEAVSPSGDDAPDLAPEEEKSAENP